MADSHLKEIIEEGARHVPNALPFIVGAMQKTPQLSRTRITEAVIIAIVLGILQVSYNVFYSMPTIKSEIDHLKDGQEDLKDEIKEIRSVLMRHREQSQQQKFLIPPSKIPFPFKRS